jgi:zinc transporter ZupT
MRMSALSRLAVVLAAALGAAGIYFESMPLILAATAGAIVFIVMWIRFTAPHDHWRALRRKRPSLL